MPKQELEILSPVQELKQRVNKIRDRLPGIEALKEMVAYNFPQYDSIKGAKLIHDVYYLRTTHYGTTEIFEWIAQRPNIAIYDMHSNEYEREVQNWRLNKPELK